MLLGVASAVVYLDVGDFDSKDRILFKTRYID